MASIARRRRIRKSPPVMQLSNRLFFEQVEAMLAEGHEVQIRMKGHSMRPLLRSERDQVVLTPCADPARLQPGDVVLFRFNV